MLQASLSPTTLVNSQHNLFFKFFTVLIVDVFWVWSLYQNADVMINASIAVNLETVLQLSCVRT